jgi:hypothetical protein
LITDTGELRTTEVSPSFSVRLLEKGLPGKIERYLDLISASRSPDLRRMLVSTEGTGERSVFVSYISEVPVWKATYRIVLNPKGGKSPLLQGWAIIDNTVGQDWTNVELSLIAGAPQSVVQNLSQPYYSRRPVVALPDSVSGSPQKYEATLMLGGATLAGVIHDPTGAAVAGANVRAYDAAGSLLGEVTSDTSGGYELRSLPDGEVRLEVESPGFQKTVINGLTVATSAPTRHNALLRVGNISESVTVTAEVPSIQSENATMAKSGRGMGGSSRFKQPPPPPSQAPKQFNVGGLVAPARAQAQASALAAELGDLFEYKLKEPITIQKNRSAMVPIVQSALAAEKVSIYNERAGLPRPQRALWLTNTTGLTLDGGSFSVLEEETFAGEGIFDPIRPNEKRLVSYATDLALNVSSRIGNEQSRVTRVRINSGTMTQQSELREKKTYTFRNEDASPRTVIVEHPVRSGYVLRGDVKPEETTAAFHRFRVLAPSKQTATLTVDEARPLSNSFAVSDIETRQLDVFVSAGSINKSMEDEFRRILAQKQVVRGFQSQISVREQEVERIVEDQQRLRENMKSLKGSAEEKALLQRYTQQLNDQETRLELLRKEMDDLEAKVEKEQVTLDSLIQALSFDVSL